MSIFSSIVSRSSWSRTCEWCEGPRWWKGRNLCPIVRTQFSVLDVHSLRQHGVALPQLKVFSSSSSLQLESNFHLSLVRLDLEVSYLVQIGKLHGLTKMHLRQLMISASFSAEWSNLVVVAMPVVVVPPGGEDALWALGPVDISSWIHESSSLFQKSTSLGSLPSLKVKGTSQLSKLCMSPPVPP